MLGALLLIGFILIVEIGREIKRVWKMEMAREMGCEMKKGEMEIAKERRR